MLLNLIVGVATMVFCLVVQSALLIVAFRYYHVIEGDTSGRFLRRIIQLNIIMCLLVLGNLGQVGVWGMVFMWLGEFQNFQDAYYHSAVNFATLGYGDIVMSEAHRILGPVQAINGVIMIGVSTAALMSSFQFIFRSSTEGR